jgi:hypothetical protein
MQHAYWRKKKFADYQHEEDSHLGNTATHVTKAVNIEAGLKLLETEINDRVLR